MRIAGLIFLLLCVGCASQKRQDPVVNTQASLTYLEPEFVPETFLFPEYLLMQGFEIERHGAMLGSDWVMASLKTKATLSATFQRLEKRLTSKGWNLRLKKLDTDSFRLVASQKGQLLEFRGVQGVGITRILLLYHP